MKKILAITLAALMALALTACGAGSSEQAPAEEASEESSEFAGMPNPWTEVETPEEAAEGAGVGSFQVPEDGTETSAGTVDWAVFQYMEGIAEADGWLGTAELTVRKGLQQDYEDVSGDYTEYKYEWSQEVDGQEVQCGGNEEGRAMKVTWLSDSCSYSIGIRGQGDLYDTYGVDADAVAALVSATR